MPNYFLFTSEKKQICKSRQLPPEILLLVHCMKTPIIMYITIQLLVFSKNRER